MLELITNYIEPILAFITGGGLLSFLTMKFTRKQAEAEAMKAVQDVYQETIKDLREDKELIKKENTDMRLQITELEKKVKQNCIDIKELQSYKCIVENCKERRIE